MPSKGLLRATFKALSNLINGDPMSIKTLGEPRHAPSTCKWCIESNLRVEELWEAGQEDASLIEAQKPCPVQEAEWAETRVAAGLKQEDPEPKPEVPPVFNPPLNRTLYAENPSLDYALVALKLLGILKDPGFAESAIKVVCTFMEQRDQQIRKDLGMKKDDTPYYSSYRRDDWSWGTGDVACEFPGCYTRAQRELDGRGERHCHLHWKSKFELAREERARIHAAEKEAEAEVAEPLPLLPAGNIGLKRCSIIGCRREGRIEVNGVLYCSECFDEKDKPSALSRVQTEREVLYQLGKIEIPRSIMDQGVNVTSQEGEAIIFEWDSNKHHQSCMCKTCLPEVEDKLRKALEGAREVAKEHNDLCVCEPCIKKHCSTRDTHGARVVTYGYMSQVRKAPPGKLFRYQHQADSVPDKRGRLLEVHHRWFGGMDAPNFCPICQAKPMIMESNAVSELNKHGNLKSSHPKAGGRF